MLMRKINNPWLSKPGYDCFGCCPDNPLGVKMEFYEDGDSVVCFWKPQAHYQGWIDTLHGGIQATLIDECASWVVFRRLQTTGVTTKLEVRYRKSIMTTEEQITIRATLSEMRRNLALIHVEIANSKGELCAARRGRQSQKRKGQACLPTVLARCFLTNLLSTIHYSFSFRMSCPTIRLAISWGLRHCLGRFCLGHKEYRLSLGRDSANECKTSLLMYCRLPLILSNDNADKCNVSFLTDCRVQFF